MRKSLDEKTVAGLGEMVKAIGGDGPFHILTPRICDRCKDEEKEAFPYGSIMATGKYNDLCNDCFEILKKEAEAHAQTYSLDIDGVDVRLPLPFSDSEESALDAFLALTPKERMAALIWLEIASGEKGILAFCENENQRDDEDFLTSFRTERIQLGSGEETSGEAELQDIMEKQLSLLGQEEVGKIAQLIDEILKESGDGQ